jgi:hypothetical protein
MKEGATTEVTLVTSEVGLQDVDVALSGEVACVEGEDTTIIPHRTPYIDMTAEPFELTDWCGLTTLHPHKVT